MIVGWTPIAALMPKAQARLRVVLRRIKALDGNLR